MDQGGGWAWVVRRHVVRVGIGFEGGGEGRGGAWIRVGLAWCGVTSSLGRSQQKRRAPIDRSPTAASETVSSTAGSFTRPNFPFTGTEERSEAKPEPAGSASAPLLRFSGS